MTKAQNYFTSLSLSARAWQKTVRGTNSDTNSVPDGHNRRSQNFNFFRNFPPAITFLRFPWVILNILSKLPSRSENWWSLSLAICCRLLIMAALLRLPPPPRSWRHPFRYCICRRNLKMDVIRKNKNKNMPYHVGLFQKDCWHLIRNVFRFFFYTTIIE